jgi:tetratricopeptide (TPR) repeat protein
MTKQNKTPNIFLSYSWQNKEEASIIENDFNRIGIPLIKDTLNLKFKDSISEYIKSIRNADFALILVSKEYLQSVNCMYEALEILKEQNHKEKILPILVNDPKIFTASDRIKFIKYWNEKKDELSKELEGLDVTSSIESYNDLKLLETIYSSIDSFLKSIGDLKTATLDELKNENYKPIIDYLGFEDVSHLIDLLIISQIENLTLKEFALKNHIAKFGISSHALFSKAKTKADLGFKEEAKVLYQESLKLDSNNSATWNNYGFLLDQQFNQINKALDCYKKAIEIDPKLIIARINLATVYSRKNKTNKAKEEYLRILEINPYEPKAHNNIANIYRKYNDKEKIIYHFTEAIKYNPKYTEAYLNFANYLDLELSDFEKAESYYNLAKRVANDKNVDIIVDKMIELLNKRRNK